MGGSIGTQVMGPGIEVSFRPGKAWSNGQKRIVVVVTMWPCPSLVDCSTVALAFIPAPLERLRLLVIVSVAAAFFPDAVT